MSCICLHMIISSQGAHLHACCVMLPNCTLKSMCLFACMSRHVLPLLGVMSSFRTKDDHLADHHLSSCSHADSVRKQGGAPAETS